MERLTNSDDPVIARRRTKKDSARGTPIDSLSRATVTAGRTRCQPKVPGVVSVSVVAGFSAEL
jgi:hypothetical protein